MLNVNIGAGTKTGTGSDNVTISTNSRATRNAVIGKDSGAGIVNVNMLPVTGTTEGSTYIRNKAASGSFTNAAIIHGSNAALNPTANNQIRIAAGGNTAIDAVPTELKFASDGVTAKASLNESWWTHNLMQNTAMTTTLQPKVSGLTHPQVFIFLLQPQPRVSIVWFEHPRKEAHLNLKILEFRKIYRLISLANRPLVL